MLFALIVLQILTLIIIAAYLGLPNEIFNNDGQITKREIRAATLAKLTPFKDDLLWDIGAGSGSVSIEWMRSGKNFKGNCNSFSAIAGELNF